MGEIKFFCINDVIILILVVVEIFEDVFMGEIVLKEKGEMFYF